MIGDKERTALAAARHWRDIGNLILVVALAIEFWLEVWNDQRPIGPIWSATENPESWSWNARRLIRDLKNALPSKHRLMVIATFLVLGGVALETWFGDKADQIADDSQHVLQLRILGMMPRSERLTPFNAKDFASLLDHKGQRVVIVIQVMQGAPVSDADTEAFADHLANLFDAAGWRTWNGTRFFIPDPKIKGQSQIVGIIHTPAMLGEEFGLEISRRASRATKDAADSLMILMADELSLHAGLSSDRLSPLPPLLTDDKDLIILTLRTPAYGNTL